MAKKEVVVEEVEALEEVVIETAPKSDTPREARFKAHVAAYKLSNPVKWARKNANGEFDKVPDSFV